MEFTIKSKKITIKLKCGDSYELKNVRSYIFDQSTNTYVFMFDNNEEIFIIPREEILSVHIEE